MVLLICIYSFHFVLGYVCKYLSEQANLFQLSRWSRSYQMFDEDEEDFECDDDDDQFSIPLGTLASSSMISETDFISEFQQAAQKHFDFEEEIQVDFVVFSIH